MCGMMKSGTLKFFKLLAVHVFLKNFLLLANPLQTVTLSLSKGAG